MEDELSGPVENLGHYLKEQLQQRRMLHNQVLVPGTHPRLIEKTKQNKTFLVLWPWYFLGKDQSVIKFNKV